MPTEREIRDAAAQVRKARLQHPNEDPLEIMQREIATFPADWRQAVEDCLFAGYEAGRATVNAVPKWIPVAGAVSALATAASLFYLLIRPEDLPSDRHTIFDIWMAFCFACSVSFIGGAVHAEGSIPIPLVKDSPVKFMAFGGIAAFIVSLLILHYIFP